MSTKFTKFYTNGCEKLMGVKTELQTVASFLEDHANIHTVL